MDDPTAYPDTGDDTGVGPDRESTTGTPRWVKVFAIVALVLVLLVVTMLLIGGGHGPGRHIPAGDPAADIPPSSVPEDHTPPPGGHTP